MKTKLFVLGTFLLLSVGAWAQNIIKGSVKGENGEPLPFVAIMVKGTQNGITSDFDGNFSITANPNDVLVFSYLGFKKQEATVKNQESIIVTMVSTTSSLEEIVVVGYGTQKKEDIVGAIASVSGTDLRKSGLTNVTHLMQDAIPGMVTEISSGQPGSDDASITIRGVSTWNGSNSPLILVDGIETTGGFSQIDPSEIASISVLKDASSTAIYGVKGANGVVLITTRRGSLGRPSITVSANVTAKMVGTSPDQLGSYDVLMLGQDAYKNDVDFTSLRAQWYIDQFKNPDRDMQMYPDVDWYDTMLKKVGWEESLRVNISGGTKFVKYFSSISGSNQGDILKNESVDGYYDPRFSYNKLNFRSNLDFRLTSSTQFKVDVSGRKEQQKTPNASVNSTQFGNVFQFIDNTPPYLFPTYYTEEFVQQNPDPLEPDAMGKRWVDLMREDPYQSNPWSEINTRGMRKYTKDVVDITLGLEQDLNQWVNGLKASVKYNYSSYSRFLKREDKYNDSFWYNAEDGVWEIQGTKADQSYERKAVDLHPSGNYEYNSSSQSIYYEAKLMYDRVFMENHSLTTVAVFNRSEKEPSLDAATELREDWVGRATYDYKKRYFINLTGAYTGSDKFAPGLRFGFFPAMGLGWNIANEPLFKEKINWNVSMIKLRYSYGKTGNDSGDRYMYLGGWGGQNARFASTRFGYPITSPDERWGEVKLANPEATWEDSYKTNLGIDVVALDDNLKFSAEFFNERRENIFLSEPIASYYHPKFGSGTHVDGDVPMPPVNIGELKNHGFEVEASYGFTLDNGINLRVGANATAVENRVIYKADAELTPEYRKNAGKPLGWQPSFITNGYVPDFEAAINSPQSDKYSSTSAGDYAFVDFNGNASIDDDDRVPYDGTSQPAFFYGVNFGVNYKGFDISARFFGKEGVYYPATNYYPNFNQHLLEAKVEHLDVWTPENTNAAFPTYRTASINQKYTLRNNANIVDASYLKLNNVTVSYLLKSDFLKRTLSISNVSLSLSGHNLYTWTKVPFGDPEGGNGISGSYGGNYPLVRRFIFDVKFNF